ncbi:exodeoxyribonuclease III [Prochlorococcus sp. MIT 1307]|uniref:exodeoxyribonuclease III n=1 Tax=Prochlorococcus sp. MIT 1307 TaxID=3096219 RepID=UPI002A74D2DA|nr:exodeoxyribonuclease III [Prochlorococcus sp. MIT 1307]
MQIATWNVNSIRTRLTQVKGWLEEVSPDLLCLQETKVADPFFPKAEIEASGYQVCFHGQKSYNGVALISRHPLKDIRLGLSGELPCDSKADYFGEQKRVISALVNGIRVVNVYVPNGSSLNSEKYTYKIQWLNCLERYLQAQSKRDEPLCILGDFNIALEDKDIHSPERLTGGIMASDAERGALQNLLGERLQDVFRLFEPGTHHWSWWDYRSGAWARDKGWRIDHIYLCEELLKNAKSCEIHKKVRGNDQPSDHAPVLTDISWPPLDEDDSDQGNDLFQY